MTQNSPVEDAYLAQVDGELAAAARRGRVALENLCALLSRLSARSPVREARLEGSLEEGGERASFSYRLRIDFSSGDSYYDEGGLDEGDLLFAECVIADYAARERGADIFAGDGEGDYRFRPEGGRFVYSRA